MRFKPSLDSMNILPTTRTQRLHDVLFERDRKTGKERKRKKERKTEKKKGREREKKGERNHNYHCRTLRSWLAKASRFLFKNTVVRAPVLTTY